MNLFGKSSQPDQSKEKASGGGFMDKLNERAGGGRTGEQKEGQYIFIA